MTSRQVRTIAAALLLGAAPYTDVFEIATRAAITQSAFDRFVRDSSAKLDDLGVYSFLSNPQQQPAPIFGVSYFDVSGNIVETRKTYDCENRIIGPFVGDNASIVGWLMRGVIREDDGYFPRCSKPAG